MISFCQGFESMSVFLKLLHMYRGLDYFFHLLCTLADSWLPPPSVWLAVWGVTPLNCCCV